MVLMVAIVHRWSVRIVQMCNSSSPIRKMTRTDPSIKEIFLEKLFVNMIDKYSEIVKIIGL